jgi:N-acyl amino acid synthase of PEP-CTERM/exosortase system
MEEKISFRKIASPDRLQEAYRLRFQVYCHECHFLKESDYPQGYETDEFDPFSAHFGAFDSEDRMVGSVRLILPCASRFPIEEHCPALEVDRNLIPRENCAEVSRLTISKLYRRRANDGLYYEPQVEDKKIQGRGGPFTRRMRPMAFGLYRAMYQESKRTGILYWFALMEKSLWKLLNIHGLAFRPIGPEVDFFGMVTPYLADIRELEKGVYSKFPEFHEYFMTGLEPELRPKFPP